MSDKNGCHNRGPKKPFLTVFDGYTDETRTQPVTQVIPDVMSEECNYSKHTKDDPKCAGCKHKHGSCPNCGSELAHLQYDSITIERSQCGACGHSWSTNI